MGLLYRDILSVAFELVILQSTLFFGHYFLFIKRLLGDIFFEYLTTLGRPIYIALCMGVLIFIFNILFFHYFIFINLLLHIILDIFFYVVLSWKLQKSFFDDIIDLISFKYKPSSN